VSREFLARITEQSISSSEDGSVPGQTGHRGWSVSIEWFHDQLLIKFAASPERTWPSKGHLVLVLCFMNRRKQHLNKSQFIWLYWFLRILWEICLC